MTYFYEGEAVFAHAADLEAAEELVSEMMMEDSDFYKKVHLVDSSDEGGYDLYKIEEGLYCICWFDAGESLACHECFTTLDEANATIWANRPVEVA